ncbi:hypothetical protein [Dokdonia sp.]|uniref:hypothetical protein n=1 Tax=Dokdonia sp. TaxID=2024995 RepID=UPI0032656C1F
MKTKFNAYGKTLYEFTNNIYVVCPKCKNQAIVTSKGFLKEKDETEIKLTCSSCGMNTYYAETPKDIWTLQHSEVTYETRNLILGANIDPYFRLPLWLQKEMPDGLLWAYNYEHLDFLEKHIHAKLRYRDLTNNHNRSLGARLPKWMTSRKNRTEVLNGIEKLKQK